MLNLYFFRTPSSEGPLPVLAENQEHAMIIFEGTDLGGTPPAAQRELFEGRYTVEEIMEWEQLEGREEWWVCWSDASWLETTVGNFLFVKTGKAGPNG